MGIADRIILTFYTFLMAVFAILLIAATLGLLPPEVFVNLIGSLPGNWEFVVGGILIFVASIRLLLAGIGVFGEGNTLTLAETEAGKTVVSKRALEEYIADIAQELYGIYGVKVAVTTEEKNTINARINALLEPGVNVFEITEEVKDNIRETVKKVVGLEVKNIEVYFKKIKNSGKDKG